MKTHLCVYSALFSHLQQSYTYSATTDNLSWVSAVQTYSFWHGDTAPVSARQKPAFEPGCRRRARGGQIKEVKRLIVTAALSSLTQWRPHITQNYTEDSDGGDREGREGFSVAKKKETNSIISTERAAQILKTHRSKVEPTKPPTALICGVLSFVRVNLWLFDSECFCILTGEVLYALGFSIFI